MPVETVLIGSEEIWTEHSSRKTWEDADRDRVTLARDPEKTVRLRYAQPDYIVEWRS